MPELAAAGAALSFVAPAIAAVGPAAVPGAVPASAVSLAGSKRSVPASFLTLTSGFSARVSEPPGSPVPMSTPSGGARRLGVRTALVDGEWIAGDVEVTLPSGYKDCSSCRSVRSVIRKDGCDFCTRCGTTGSCG